MLAVIKMTIAAPDEAACRTLVEQTLAGMRATVQSVDENEDRWDVVATAPAAEGDQTDAVAEVLRRLNVTATVESGPGTAWAVLSDVSPTIEWLMVEAWDSADSAEEPELEELTGEGDGLSQAELAELTRSLDEVVVTLTVQWRGDAREGLARLTERLRTVARYVATEPGDDRVKLRFAVAGADPQTVVQDLVQQYSERDGWSVRQDGAVWANPAVEQGITRIEVKASRPWG